MNNIGAKIKSEQKKKGLTQQELGELLGVQDSAIAKYEKGRVVNIKRSTLQKLSEILNVSPAELIMDIESQKNIDVCNSIYARLQTDKRFLEIVEMLNNLDEEKLNGVQAMLALIK